MQSDANWSHAPNSLLTGKITGKFTKSLLPGPNPTSDFHKNSKIYGQIPCSAEQGIFGFVAGNFEQRIREFESVHFSPHENPENAVRFVGLAAPINDIIIKLMSKRHAKRRAPDASALKSRTFRKWSGC
jgi:hypothetical protein